eukprot:CAMPEP_0115880352 /NCGR_PEP_ID=MMETSP0287-20121206/27825_1 /TAXON_ID=412157 /ORGANISM="Chrysochromulina rotalis, Strain UIO044" /LENGTH=38 /DNA_ID= /DNA_START= /DNA_END= /DNA_ORIENTATION=
MTSSPRLKVCTSSSVLAGGGNERAAVGPTTGVAPGRKP